MNLLVLGENGQLAWELRQRCPMATFWGRRSIDMADTAALERKVLAARPHALINAAAYTAVDGAESAPDLAWRLNAEAPAALARAARQLEIPFVPVSSDFVFDGKGDEPFRDTDPVGPINVYGRTKLAGELAVASQAQRYLILRTSWVFSAHGHNFVKTMLRLAAERDTLRVVADQIGNPTWAGDLAQATLKAVDAMAESREAPRRTWHLCGGDAVSWHQFAEAIINGAHAQGRLARKPVIEPIATEDYPTPAARPLNSRLAPSADLLALLDTAPDWRWGLERILREGDVAVPA